jgi:hypothetical protein
VPDLSLKERCRKRLEGLKQTRSPYEAEAKEIASYAQPARSRFLSSDTNKNVRQRNARLNSSHGVFAFEILQAGITSGLSSPSRPWFMLALSDEDANDDPQVKAWFAIVQKRMEAFFAITNAYGAFKSGYLELALFGTEACVAVEHPEEGMVCHQLTFGEYWIGLGSSLKPEALYRRCPTTVNQVVQKNRGTQGLSNRITAAYDASRYEEPCEFFHAIERNDEWEQGYADWRGKPWRSVYWDENDNDRTRDLWLKGCEEQPFWAPRWDTPGSDAWGQGPGHVALPDLRELQLQAKRKGEATDYHIWPEMIAPAKVKLRRQPKSVVAAAGIDAEGIKVPYQVPYQAIEAVRLDLEACKQAINQATRADLFMAITNMQGVQPRNVEEIASRNEEKLTQLGPVIERVNGEKLQVAIDRAYGILERAGALPPAPEAVREAGGHLKVEFVSILTQMQRMVGLGQIERTTSFVGNIVGMFPEARHKIDALELVDEYATRAGMPAKLIRTNEEAQQDAEAEQQAANQQRMAEMAAKAGPALKDVVDAGRLASEIQPSDPMATQAPVPL